MNSLRTKLFINSCRSPPARHHQVHSLNGQISSRGLVQRAEANSLYTFTILLLLFLSFFAPPHPKPSPSSFFSTSLFVFFMFSLVLFLLLPPHLFSSYVPSWWPVQVLQVN